MSDHVCLTSHLVVMRTHCLAENVAFISFEYLLIPQSQQLPISLHLYRFTLIPFMASLTSFLYHAIIYDQFGIKWLHCGVLVGMDHLHGVH